MKTPPLLYTLCYYRNQRSWSIQSMPTLASAKKKALRYLRTRPGGVKIYRDLKVIFKAGKQFPRR